MVPTSLRTTRMVQWAVASFLSTVVSLYLGLIGLGQWYADEYGDFAMLADQGWGAILTRIRWSPRPVSEFLFCSYGSLVNRLHDPLIVPFLAVLWAGFLIAGLLTCMGIRWNRPKEDFWPDLLVALALMAFSVAYGPIMEVFYWPAGAAAYLPTLSATFLLFLQVVRGRLATSRGRRLCSACLLVAACSSETGAILVASYALILAIESAIAIQRGRNTSGRRFPGWWLIPGVISVLLLGVVRLYRYNAVERPISAVSSALGHPFVSLLAGGKELVLEMLGQTVHSGAWFGLGSILPSEFLLAAGASLCWSRLGRLPRTTRSQVVTLSSAFLLGCLLTIAAAELHFGAVCCRQHEVIRRCWILLSLTGFAIVLLNSSVTYFRDHPVSPLIGPILLCSAIFVVWHVSPLFKEYRFYGALKQATEQNFQSGFNPHNTEMIFLLQPPDALIAGEQVPAGRYTLDSLGPEYPHYILRFFHKQSIVVRPANDWLGASVH
jgi:hypothetical protein